MKRMAALILAAMLCCLCFSAQGAEKLVSYTHPTCGYTLRRPPEWLLVDAANVDGYIEAYQSGALKHGAADAEYLTQMAPILHADDSVVMLDLNGNYLQLICYPISVKMTLEQFMWTVLPGVLEEMKAYYPDGEYLTDGEIVDYGDNRYALLSVNFKDEDGMPYCEDWLFLLEAGYIMEVYICAQELINPQRTKEFYAQARKVLASIAFPVPAAE